MKNNILRRVIEGVEYIFNCCCLIRQGWTHFHAKVLRQMHGKPSLLFTEIRRVSIVQGLPKSTVLYATELGKRLVHYSFTQGNAEDLNVFAVRYISEKDNAFRSALVRCYPSELKTVVRHVDSLHANFKYLVAFLNGIDITQHIAPMMASFCLTNSLRVIDVVDWLLAQEKLSRQVFCAWPLEKDCWSFASWTGICVKLNLSAPIISYTYLFKVSA